MTPNAPLSEEQLAKMYLSARHEYRDAASGSCDKQRHAACLDVIILIAAHRALTARCQTLEEALQLLYDVQNGSPLPSYTAEWDQAMAQARTLLSREGPE